MPRGMFWTIVISVAVAVALVAYVVAVVWWPYRG